MSPDHITGGTYNQNINKHLACHMVWLCESNPSPGARSLETLGVTIDYGQYVPTV